MPKEAEVRGKGDPATKAGARDEAIQTPSSNLAKKNGDDGTGYVSQNTDDRPMNNEAHVYVGKDGDPLSGEAARTAGGALLNVDTANPSGPDAKASGPMAA